MGVNDLWSLLSDIKQDISLSQCSGKKLAIDLSSWLVSSAQISSGPSPDFLRCRTIFFRTLNLLSLGITPVFITDSKDAPFLKKRKRGQSFFMLVEEYQEFLKALGVPVLQSPGEAEKMCASLNHMKIVDGCLTDDGDTFVYGAQTVYKGFFTDKQVPSAQKYEMTDIEKRLNLSQRDLVVFALMSGSDMCDGVDKIGKVKFMDLVHELHNNGITDILDRIQSWRDNEQLIRLKKMSEELERCPTLTHCSKCSHEGNIQRHIKNGCLVCKTQDNCLKGGPSCPCPYHTLEAAVKPFKNELKIRKSALTTKDFPSPKVISEYLDSDGDSCDVEASSLILNLPDLHKVCEIVGGKLKYSQSKILSHLIPVIIKMHLYGLLADFDIKPIEILKMKSKEQFYVVEWEPFACLKEFDVMEGSYRCDIQHDLFKSKFADMAQNYHVAKSTNAVRKRKQVQKSTDDPRQSKLTKFFQVQKDIQQRGNTSTCPGTASFTKQ